MQTPDPFTGVSRPLSLDFVEQRILDRYRVSGFSTRTWDSDRALLRRLHRMAGDLSNVTVEHFEEIILGLRKQNSRAQYCERFKSLWKLMRDLGIVDTAPDAELPDIRRTKDRPRPLTDAQADKLLRLSSQPMQDWFVLGIYQGLRAMEVSQLRGSDLEERSEGFYLRIRGKGGTDMEVPAHPVVVEMIQAHGRLGRLWTQNAHNVSRMACAEMRRLGVEMQFHSCRHYFATVLLAASGGDIVTTAELMRHASIQTTMTYAKLADDRPRAVLNMVRVAS